MLLLILLAMIISIAISSTLLTLISLIVFIAKKMFMFTVYARGISPLLFRACVIIHSWNLRVRVTTDKRQYVHIAYE
jgi:hypothetical protein